MILFMPRTQPSAQIDKSLEADLFRSLFSNPLVGLAVSQDGLVVLANPAAEAIVGYSHEELAALPPWGFMDLVHPENRERVRMEYKRRINGLPPTRAYLVQLKHAQGGWRWVRIHPAPVSLHGRPAALALLVDETQRVEAIKLLKKSEQELQEERRTLEANVRERTAQLEDAYTYLRATHEHSHDGIMVIDANGCFEDANPACYRILGWPAKALVGQFFLKVIPPERHAFMMERWAEAQAGRGAPYETEVVGRDGTRRAIHVSHRHMTIRGERKYAVVIADITELKQAQAEMRARGEALEREVAERTRALTEANVRLRAEEMALERAQAIAHIGSYEWHPQSGWLHWSREMRRIHGLDPDAPFPPPHEELRALNHPDDVERLLRAMEQTLKHGRPLNCSYRLCLPDGSVRHVLARGERRPDVSAGETYYLDGTVQDITEQRELEREIIKVSQREQQRIGAEIHDSLGQELSALSMMISALGARIEDCCPPLKAEVDRISNLAQEAVRHARALAHGLTPVDIALGGLADELQQLARNIMLVYDVEVRFHEVGSVSVQDEETANHLYRIAREAITNSIRHGKATHIDMELRARRRRGTLSVQDNGRWAGEPADESSGAGLRIMRHRAHSIGGRLDIHVSPGTGTCVQCRFPNAPRPAPGA